MYIQTNIIHIHTYTCRYIQIHTNVTLIVMPRVDYAQGHNYAPGHKHCICMYLYVLVCIIIYEYIYLYMYVYDHIILYMHVLCLPTCWKRQNGHLQMMGCPPLFLHITISLGQLFRVATQLEMSYNLNSY